MSMSSSNVVRRVQKDVKANAVTVTTNTGVGSKTDVNAPLEVKDQFVLNANYFQSFVPSSWDDTNAGQTIPAEQIVDGLIDVYTDNSTFSLLLPPPTDIINLIGAENTINKFFDLVVVNNGSNTFSFFTGGWQGFGLGVSPNSASYYRLFINNDTPGSETGFVQIVGRSIGIPAAPAP